jgi:FKBP-type peptidyl-prolyl cis-trans isomerase FklB
MKIGIILTVALAGAPLWMARAEDKPAFKDEKEKASYAIGMSIGSNLKGGHYDVDLDVVTAAIKDVLAGRNPKMTEPEAREALMAYRQTMMQKMSEQNHKAGEAFLAANKTKPGVKTETVTLPDGTTAEYQYKVLVEGTGETPKPTDVVTVNYRGTLIDGTEFDNSAKRGKPAQFAVTRVVRGWTEALEHMKVGSKWQLFLPPTLAYAERSAPGIEPGSTLIFEMELLKTEAAPQAASGTPGQPALNSDIVRVPSAEELKKGAQVEVIKAADAEKLRAATTNQTAKPGPK